MSAVEKMCLSKAVFSLESKAAAAAEKITKTSGKTFGHYKCPNCRAYHLTSKPNKKRSSNPEHVQKRDEKIAKKRVRNMTESQLRYEVKRLEKRADSVDRQNSFLLWELNREAF